MSRWQKFLGALTGLAALLAASGGCRRTPAIEIYLDKPERVTLQLVDTADGRTAEPIREELLPAGIHRGYLEKGNLVFAGKDRGAIASGTWQWMVRAHPEFKPVARGWACQPGGLDNPWPASGGPPSSVTADEAGVYLGHSPGSANGAIVALETSGSASAKPRWTHQRDGFGVQSLGADQGTIFVLACPKTSGGGTLIYKLSARDGKPVPWTGRDSLDLPITSLWSDPEGTKPKSADSMAVANGRIYLSFTEAGYVAIIDEADGHYVLTVTAPSPRQMSLSTTPVRDADGRPEIADFGVVVLGSSILSYFVMPHDPPWLAANSSHRLDESERITAFTMDAKTMSTGEVQLVVALAPPHQQIQRISLEAPEGYNLTAGKAGGRPAPPHEWDPESLGPIPSMALDSNGALWVAEASANPARFTRWRPSGRLATLEAEYFSPPSPGQLGAAVFPNDPKVLVAGSCQWALRDNAPAECKAVISPEPMLEASFIAGTDNGPVLCARHPLSLRFYRRDSGDKWRIVASLEASGVYWADTNGDGERQTQELEKLQLDEMPTRAMASGALTNGTVQYPLKGWTTSGAPLFDWTKQESRTAAGAEQELLEASVPAGQRTPITRMADGRAFFVKTGSGFSVYELEGAAALRVLGKGTLGGRAR